MLSSSEVKCQGKEAKRSFLVQGRMEKVEILKNNVIYRVWKEVLHKLSHEDSHQQQSTRKESKQKFGSPGKPS